MKFTNQLKSDLKEALYRLKTKKMLSTALYQFMKENSLSIYDSPRDIEYSVPMDQLVDQVLLSIINVGKVIKNTEVYLITNSGEHTVDLGELKITRMEDSIRECDQLLTDSDLMSVFHNAKQLDANNLIVGGLSVNGLVSLEYKLSNGKGLISIKKRKYKDIKIDLETEDRIMMEKWKGGVEDNFNSKIKSLMDLESNSTEFHI